MKFEKSQIIKNDENFIIFGKIKDTFAVIFSDFKINKIDLNLTDEQFSKEYFWNFKIDDKEINVVCQKDDNTLFFDNKKNNYIIIKEKPEIYKKHILPYINNLFELNTKWIFNIINGKTEQDKVLLKESDHIIVKDTNWNTESNDMFYILSIPFEQIKTIRDLRKKHIPLLEDMKNKCLLVAKDYLLKESQLYFFFHYHPSFYQLHLHCVRINHPKLSAKYFRCNMLDTVISNLKKSSYYYKNKTLSFEIPKNHPVVKIIEATE